MIKNFARLEPNYNGLRRVNKELPASDWNAIRNYLHTYEALLETTKVLQTKQLITSESFFIWKKAIFDLRKIGKFYNIMIKCISFKIIHIIKSNYHKINGSNQAKRLIRELEDKERELFSNELFTSAVFLDLRAKCFLSSNQIEEACETLRYTYQKQKIMDTLVRNLKLILLKASF